MSKLPIKNPERLAFVRRESLRVGGWSPELKNYLAKNQLSLGTVMAHASWLNIALVKFMGGNSGDETFLFDADGEPAAVIEALLFDHYREQYTADLVAWPINDPAAFTTAMGINDGADILGPQWMIQRRGAPLMVHRTPLRWLQAGCEGCVALKPGARHWLHRAGGPFVAEDIEHGRELRDLLGSYAAKYRIMIPEKARAA